VASCVALASVVVKLARLIGGIGYFSAPNRL
jgi:hypothetical protein